jgi:lipopolysaccharide export LptBFGC system permease protein LptF
MNQEALTQLSASELRQRLEANAEKSESLTFNKPLTEEEVEKEIKDFSQLAIEIQQKEDKLDEIKDEFKTILKPLKTSFSEKLKTIRSKSKTVTETVYLIPDFETGLMETYSQDGVMIQSRRLTPEERQLSIHKSLHLHAVNED